LQKFFTDSLYIGRTAFDNYTENTTNEGITMFDFISNIIERITYFFTQVVLLIIIVLAVVLLVLATNRHNKNPYVDHSKQKQMEQIEADREAQYKEALQRLYDEQYGK
jgi:flagellar biosynthesis/type III secretory pathway M-ring protein FliF/YscJ